jgi:hypothetical protein
MCEFCEHEFLADRRPANYVLVLQIKQGTPTENMPKTKYML